ncbi:MAG: N-acetylmuramoyl-L-alanine amidase, partial [uncultured Gemmatimonadaceae bacterium]
ARPPGPRGAAPRRRGRRPRRARPGDERPDRRPAPRRREGRHPRGRAPRGRSAPGARRGRAHDPHHRHPDRAGRPRPHRQRAAWRPVPVHPRERGESELARARARARLRDVLPRRGEDRGGEPGGADGERGGALRDRRQRAEGRPAQLHHQRHGAERAPPRVVRPRRGDPAVDGSRAPRPEPGGEAGQLRRAPHLVHAGRARGARLRDQRRGGRLPGERRRAGGAGERDRRRHGRLPRAVRPPRARLGAV